MTVEHLKSVGVTNLDATPPLSNSPGEQGLGLIRDIDGWVTVSASASTGSTYQLVRVPTNCKMKALTLESEAQGAGKINLSVYYSDALNDGTSAANQGVIVPTTGDQFFASDVDLAAAVTPINEINESGNNTIDKRVQPLWKALGLATDPGGYFDIVAVVHTTAVTTGTGKLYVRASYVM